MVAHDGDMGNGAYSAAYQQSLTDPEGFWGEAAKAIDWITPPHRVLDADRPPFYRWFTGGTLNTCFNALDRHVAAGRGDQPALHYDSPVTDTRETITYAALLDRVATFAGALASLGVDKGDRVVIYMPMVPEAVVAMLACARLGAVHSVVFGGFAPAELAARIEDAKPTVVVAASCGVEPTRVVEYKPLLDAALDRSSHKPESVIVLQRPEARAAVGERDTDWEELDWDELVSDAEPADCVEVAATDPLYILYTSGTTGRPKGIVRDNGGHAVALRWSMGNVFGIGAGRHLVHCQRRRLGRRPLLHRLRSSAGWCDFRSVRRETGRYPGRQRVLAGHRRLRREGHVHRPDGLPGDQAGRPRGCPDEGTRPVLARDGVPRR